MVPRVSGVTRPYTTNLKETAPRKKRRPERRHSYQYFRRKCTAIQMTPPVIPSDSSTPKSQSPKLHFAT